jgi:mannose-6-phosphate isomerase
VGVHPKAPATADVAGIAMPLDRLIAEAPDRVLGRSASARFGGRLPICLRSWTLQGCSPFRCIPPKSRPPTVLPARTRPESTWAPTNGTTRMRITKREMAVALTDFWMLHGFRPLDQIAEALRKVPELRSIMPDFSVRLARAGDATQARRDLRRDHYRAVMTMPQERVDLLLNALVERLATRARSDKDGR